MYSDSSMKKLLLGYDTM